MTAAGMLEKEAPREPQPYPGRRGRAPEASVLPATGGMLGDTLMIGYGVETMTALDDIEAGAETAWRSTAMGGLATPSGCRAAAERLPEGPPGTGPGYWACQGSREREPSPRSRFISGNRVSFRSVGVVERANPSGNLSRSLSGASVCVTFTFRNEGEAQLRRVPRSTAELGSTDPVSMCCASAARHLGSEVRTPTFLDRSHSERARAGTLRAGLPGWAARPSSCSHLAGEDTW